MYLLRVCVRVLVVCLCVWCCAKTGWAAAVLRVNGGEAMPVYTRSVTASAEISGQFARTTLIMIFANESESQIEADFVYALPKGAVATYFAYWAGDEKVEAKIVEKKEAARVYEHLTTYRRDPALIELTGKNTFRARISPIFPGHDLKVEIRYVQALQSGGDSVSYSVPIGPVDPKQPDPLEFVDATVRVTDDGGVCSVSNNYGVPVAKASGSYSVSIKGRSYRPPKELAVRVTRHKARLRAELYAENGHFSLALTPDHSLKHPRVSVSGVTQLAPSRLPDVKAGQAVVVSGRYAHGGKARVTLSGQGRSYSTTVDFGSSSSLGIAPKLWAAARIGDLGSMRSNRKAVVELSFSYGLPSRYTSWLAVPKQETQGLEYEKAELKLSELARKMAPLIADGKKDSAEYKALEAEYERTRKPFDAEQTEWLVPSALEEKRREAISKIVELRFSDKPDREVELAWRARAERLTEEIKILSPDSQRRTLDEDIAENERWWLESVCSNLGEKLANLALAGKSSSQEAESLKARYLRLHALLPADSYAKKDQIARHASSQAYTLAEQVVYERHKAKPNKRRLAELMTKLQRIAPVAGVKVEVALSVYERQLLDDKAWEETVAYQDAIADGKVKEAEAHRQRYRALSSSAGRTAREEELNSGLEYRFRNAVSEYLMAKQNPSTKSSELRHLRERAERLAKLTGKSLETQLQEYAKSSATSDAAERMYDAAGSLSSELFRDQPYDIRAKRLRKATEKIASELKRVDSDGYYSRAAAEFNAAADQAMAAWLEEQRASAESGDPAKLEQATKAREKANENLQANLYSIRSTVRGGDPLIGVEAPQDALSVIALLPGGDVKTLAWNAANKRWEARFDVPTGTPDGDYVVQIVVVLADGTRKLTSANYKVDNVPPSGIGTAVVSGHSVRLEIRPSEDVARVVALLPWGERVELTRSSDGDTYWAVVSVPAGSAMGQVEFVLTDNAHNRNTVVVRP